MQMSLYQLLDQVLAFLQDPHAPSAGVVIILGIILVVIIVAFYVLWSVRNKSHKRPQIYGRDVIKRHR